MFDLKDTASVFMYTPSYFVRILLFRPGHTGNIDFLVFCQV